MVFQDPILAGTTLVRDNISSANYAPGTAGWQITRDGNAEFNAAKFRGPITDFDNLGNLVAQLDAAGLAIGPTLQTPASSRAQIVPQPNVPANLQTYYTKAGYTVITAILFYTKLGDYSYIALLQGGFEPKISIGVSNNGTVTEKMFISNTVFTAVDLTWQDPVTGSDALGDWQLLTPLNGWVNRPGYAALQVKRIPSPKNSGWLIGSFNPAGTITDGIKICTLPPGFIPNTSIGVPVQTSATVAGGQSPTLDIKSNGDVLFYGVRGAFTGFSAIYPLDAIAG